MSRLAILIAMGVITMVAILYLAIRNTINPPKPDFDTWWDWVNGIQTGRWSNIYTPKDNTSKLKLILRIFF